MSTVLNIWEIIFLSFSILTFLLVVFGLFFATGDRTKYRDATEIFPVSSQEFLTALARVSNSPIEWGGGVKILKNGIEFFPALLRAINNAQTSVTFTVYIWEDGKASDQIFTSLIAALKRGVAVKLLLDGFGCFYVPKNKVQELKDAGAMVSVFRAPRFGKLTRFHRRSHSRAIVIDGTIGFTGGMAVADHWLGNASNPKEWRDTMFLLTGNMAQSLQSVFAQLWAGTRGEILAGEKFYPGLVENKKDSCYISVASSPSSDTQPLPKFFWLSMASAKESIYITSSYVVPDRHIREILMSQAKKGLDVRLLLPNKYSDAKPIRFASHYYFESFLKAGVKIYEYRPTMIHSKIMVVDGKWSVIGSANMDARSVELNEENVLGILNPKLGSDLNQSFFGDVAMAKEIKLQNWQKRGVWQKIMERVWITFRKQY